MNPDAPVRKTFMLELLQVGQDQLVGSLAES